MQVQSKSKSNSKRLEKSDSVDDLNTVVHTIESERDTEYAISSPKAADLMAMSAQKKSTSATARPKSPKSIAREDSVDNLNSVVHTIDSVQPKKTSIQQAPASSSSRSNTKSAKQKRLARDDSVDNLNTVIETIEDSIIRRSAVQAQAEPKPVLAATTEYLQSREASKETAAASL